ncbi:MAG: glycosyltransferase [Acidimicrobiales bacterium]|nr:glycosyltransferase [Acidimicrobiales bacterium]
MISVVMPAHNEAGYLEPSTKTVVEGLRGRRLDFEVIIVENGSSDSTGDEAEALHVTFGEVQVLRRPEADYGLALKQGFLAARGDIVINLDVDLVDLDFIDRALAGMTQPDVAVLVGSKRAPGAQDQRTAARRLITAVFAVVLRLGFGLRTTDTHGLKALRRDALLPLVEQCQHGKDIFDTELLLRAQRAGLITREVPVSVTDMRPPRTSIGRRIPRTIVGLIRLRLSIGHPA